MNWKLSDDRRTLSIETGTGATAAMGWDHPVTDEELDNALAQIPALMDELRSSEVHNNLHRRYPTRFGTFYLSKLVGPPTWWYPRFQIGRWHFAAGWLQRAYRISWKKPPTKPRIPIFGRWS